MAVRQLEKWEEKYYKNIINKDFKFFKWSIGIHINITNTDIYVEWEKEWKKRMKEVSTITKTNVKGKTYYVNRWVQKKIT